MIISEFIDLLDKTEMNKDNIESVSKAYGCDLPNELCSIVSLETPLFFDGGRVMDAQEIIYASEDHNVDYAGLGLIPCIDCFDNDFLVYDISKKLWTKFSVADKICFGEESADLTDVLSDIANR